MTTKKERFEIILEPLQGFLQLAFLSFCPIGTKLSIQNNLLFVQPPGWHQGIIRTYNHDTKDDVFFLFNVVRRFNKYYQFMASSKIPAEVELFKLLKELGKSGIDNLIQTYSQANNPALLHTLQMYKKMIDKPEQDDMDDMNINVSIQNGGSNDKKMNIDDIFIKIVGIYDKHELKLMYHTLALMKKHNNEHLSYINGLNLLLDVRYNGIKKWISDNIVF